MGWPSSAMRPRHLITALPAAAPLAAYLSGGLPADPSSNVPEAISSSIAAARAFICSADGVELTPRIIPRRMNRRCLAVGLCPVSM